MNKVSKIFIALGLLALLTGALIGVLAGIQIVYPQFLKGVFAFNKMRPLHVSTVIGWIILTATGGVYYYLNGDLNLKLYSNKLLKAHLILFVFCAVAIYISYFTGNMGGREYLTFYPLIAVPIIFGWILFGINYFKTTLNQVKNWPVYLWMWATGIVFMIYHLTEAHLWIIPYFRENFIKDITVQWKSYGSFVGSWNMLVYGTSIYVMSKIKKEENLARGKKVFFFYFLGLINLMFGWAHHTYIVPSFAWLRYLAYAVSMTEWILLINIITNWAKSLNKKQKEQHHFAYLFLKATNFWVFFNLIGALLISIPYINFFTHGTRITVAHSMGTTIGINTTILLASVTYICSQFNFSLLQKYFKTIRLGFWIFNFAFALFLLCLYASGVNKSIWMYFSKNTTSFTQMQDSLHNIMLFFLLCGVGIFISLILIAFPFLKILLSKSHKASLNS